MGPRDSGKTLRFLHGGRDEGFDALMVAYAESGQGAVVMINTNDNSGMTQRIIDAIARQYHWPAYPAVTPANRERLVPCDVRQDRIAARTSSGIITRPMEN